MYNTEDYHFHRECANYPQCTIKDDKVDGHKVKRFWCPKMSEIKHEQTGTLNGRTYNMGEAYDKAGGQTYYPSDLHSIRYECLHFEKYQNQLELN